MLYLSLYGKYLLPQTSIALKRVFGNSKFSPIFAMAPKAQQKKKEKKREEKGQVLQRNLVVAAVARETVRLFCIRKFKERARVCESARKRYVRGALCNCRYAANIFQQFCGGRQKARTCERVTASST